MTSYQNLDSTNTKLTTELDNLRTKITTLQASRGQNADGMTPSEGFDPFDYQGSVDEAAARMRACS